MKTSEVSVYNPHIFTDPEIMQCSRCKKYKRLEHFRCEEGKYPSTLCVVCEKIWAKELRLKKVVAERKSDIDVENSETYLRIILRARLLAALRHGSKMAVTKKLSDFSITPTYLEQLYKLQEGKCAVSGTRMALGVPGENRRPHKHLLSLDRIDRMRGYVKGNVRLVTYHVNMAHSTYSDEDLLEMCRAVVQHHEKKSAAE